MNTLLRVSTLEVNIKRTSVETETMQAPKKLKTAHSLTNFLVIYFKFAFFLCFCPFWLRKTKTGLFVCEKNVVQGGLCAFITGLAFMHIIASFRSTFKYNTEENASPLIYFVSINFIFSNSVYILSVISFWCFRHRFVCIVNFIQCNSDVFPNKPLLIQRRIFISFVCIIYTAMAFRLLTQRKDLDDTSNWDKTIWNLKLTSGTRYTFFMMNFTEALQASEPEKMQSFDYFIKFIGVLMYYMASLMRFYPDLSIFMIALTVWTASYQFTEKLQQNLTESMQHKSDGAVSTLFKQPSNKVQWPEIYGYYQSLRQLCGIVNHAFGSMVTLQLAACLLAYSTSIDQIIVEPDVGTRIQTIFFFIVGICFLITSADICDQIGKLKEWLSNDENRRGVPVDQLQIILAQLSSREIGIRGSNSFTITFPLLWNVMTTMVTYFIICMQAKQLELNLKKDDIGPKY